MSDLADNNKRTKMQLALLVGAISAGLTTASNTAFADDGNVSEKDMLAQAVALYEKLSGNEVELPRSLAEKCGDDSLGKAVMLGFKNTNDIVSVSDSTAIRKQDALTILYKTIISYDYSYALTSDEIDSIMNDCYDNALVDEENRAAYAFMLKHDIILDNFDTEPNKLITWSSCSTLVDVLYDLFVQDTSFTIGDYTIKIGTTAQSVVDYLGEPIRIDDSDYDFDWYIYNSNPEKLIMVGVKEGRVCAFFTNSSDFSFGDIHSGDDYLFAYKYIENDEFRIFKDNDGRIDAVLYNPYTKSDVTLENSTYLRSCELVDIINAQRTKRGLDTLNIDDELYSTANDMVSQPKYQELARDERFSHISDDAQHEQGYDIFAIYEKLLASDSNVFDSDTRSIGVSTYTDDEFNIYASIICSDVSAALTTEPSDINAVEPDTYIFETEAQASEIITSENITEFVFETPDVTETETVRELVHLL